MSPLHAYFFLFLVIKITERISDEKKSFYFYEPTHSGYVGPLFQAPPPEKPGLQLHPVLVIIPSAQVAAELKTEYISIIDVVIIIILFFIARIVEID